jgi:diguanylate cyclase (GGDEF)-like protein
MYNKSILATDSHFYTHALYILIIASVFAFFMATQKIDREHASDVSLKYYNFYFILGLLGWIATWINDVLNISSNLTFAAIFYILASYSLLIAISECPKRKLYKINMDFIHVLFIIFSLLLDNNADRVIFIAVYAFVTYQVIFYLSFKRARERKNIGNSITCAAALFLVVMTPFEVYFIVIKNDVSVAYGLSMIASSTTFILMGIGFLTSVMVAEHQKLTLLSLTDPLTGLYNRRGMDLSLVSLPTPSQSSEKLMGIISIDIDYFKKINDSYGHDAGDYVLQKLTKVFLQYIRSTDICCRLGGEEFVIVFPETTKNDVIAVAERIRKNIETLELFYHSQTIKLTSSFGVAVHSGDIDCLLKDADKALYTAKAEGRNRTCVSN